MNDGNVARWQRQRHEFSGLHARITRAALARHLDVAGPVLEIGAGGGQLRSWAPEPLRPALVHLDREARLLQALRGAHGAAPTVVADAHRLPFANASFRGAVGLCALDVVADPAQVLAELVRVMAPGAAFVHLLDLATSLEPVFADVIARRCVALPNFVAGLPNTAVPAHLLEALEPDVDLLQIPQARFVMCVQRLAAVGHPLTGTLASWGRAFLPGEGDVRSAVRLFVRNLADPAQRQGLFGLWAKLHELSERGGHAMPPLDLEPLSSLRHFRARLQSASSLTGWKAVFDEVVVAHERRVRPEGFPAHVSGLLNHVGQVAASANAAPLRGVPVARLEGSREDEPDSIPEADGHDVLFSAAVHVFVAARA